MTGMGPPAGILAARPRPPVKAGTSCPSGPRVREVETTSRSALSTTTHLREAERPGRLLDRAAPNPKFLKTLAGPWETLNWSSKPERSLRTNQTPNSSTSVSGFSVLATQIRSTPLWNLGITLDIPAAPRKAHPGLALAGGGSDRQGPSCEPTPITCAVAVHSGLGLGQALRGKPRPAAG